jgi:glycosidase
LLQADSPAAFAASPQTASWHEAVIYQIYPRSFLDTNRDGIGDLAGIIARLDYFVWLEVTALWWNPIYPSAMADFGNDITDDATTNQYYLHTSLAAQPDLNWRNPAVEAAMFDVVRF